MGPIASREPSQGALVRAIPPMFRCACGRGQGHRNTGHRNTRASRCCGRAASRRLARPAGRRPARRPAQLGERALVSSGCSTVPRQRPHSGARWHQGARPVGLGHPG